MADNTTGDLAHRIATPIHLVRGQRVMLDEDLAQLHGVPTKALNQRTERFLGGLPPESCSRSGWLAKPAGTK